MLHTFLIVIEILIGVAALAGGVFALLGAAGVPQAWLEGAPFSTYRIPGVIRSRRRACCSAATPRLD
jgi:hypothetical protein